MCNYPTYVKKFTSDFQYEQWKRSIYNTSTHILYVCRHDSMDIEVVYEVK